MTAAEVTLPLSSGTVAARATETKGFASLPSLEVVEEELERLAALPGSGAVTWASLGRAATRAKRLRFAAVAVAVAVTLFALANAWR